MKNFINSASDRLKEENSLDNSFDKLFSNFMIDVNQGKIKLKSVNDLSKLVEIKLTLDEIKKKEEVPEELQYNVFDELINDSNLTIDQLYDKAYEMLNENNDNKNKGN